ncbi:tyrosine-type recombinase/integrase [Nonomuraea sp. KC401]|uniref:tyrosine-type recombinase/integrase n=1 Tax=Nonomuraea sp. KC401 TaxID=1848324 RepID=UPI00207BBDB9|nr:tyrosine-type recombinase/integrase [Nonomuraea sp. KC401]
MRGRFGRPARQRPGAWRKTASAELDPNGEGWTLHQLRHSALQHLAEAGRTAPELQAKSRHQSLSSLRRYLRLARRPPPASPPSMTPPPGAGPVDVRRIPSRSGPVRISGGAIKNHCRAIPPLITYCN